MWSIRQQGDNWEVLDSDGNVLGAHPSYDTALVEIAALARASLATDGEGLLSETWADTGGICFSQATGDGRDFTNCEWTWRDPESSLLPLMLQTETDFGHFGAQLAGFMATLAQTDGTVHATGRFYDTEEGREARTILQSRAFGVSVDPGAVEAEFTCTEEDDDGWCIDGTLDFTAYEIIGLTMTPFPAFADAAIGLSEVASTDGEEDTADEPAETARSLGRSRPDPEAQLRRRSRLVASAPTRPPTTWFERPEAGEPTPLTIADDGEIYGHLATWGSCHVGRQDLCLAPPRSEVSYAHFHVGEVLCADGTRVPTGTLTIGCDHAALALRAPEARDHYAHSGAAFADVRVSDGELGPWCSGAQRPDVDELQLRVLRASALSGDWRRIGGNLELIGVLAVNVPGFAIPRSLAASAGVVELPRQRAHLQGHTQTALVASGPVLPCEDCRGGAERGGTRTSGRDPRMGEVLGVLATLERRTRHLVPDAMAAAAARIRR